MHNIINDFAPGRPNEWKSKSSLVPHMLDAAGQRPRTCGQEIAGIIGYGAVGMFFFLSSCHEGNHDHATHLCFIKQQVKN